MKNLYKSCKLLKSSYSSEFTANCLTPSLGMSMLFTRALQYRVTDATTQHSLASCAEAILITAQPHFHKTGSKYDSLWGRSV